ncbi:mitochondrial pyruvate carrier protein, putative [Leishmania panamensis]|uniref:Mitochondrial pyruvate carrier n=8 Tax=Viannia TaxID=37616 RepID=A4H359_LEIBR|nr:conserved hypothetical protein [Leishmania braziliensis MHOM/BR/75/M2904]XP_010696678.1 mitochondrial pyruvate carrier protein, putative [Leishmania panamensis]KAI5686246.1 hypothetical protein MNV84_00156 [Leishmania braziliensis]CCM12503.1 hypothetical protein, conserved [Leishmania guyanensis]AIN95136.1 mitochondrial pyruvate carrier protein, putative [Leishmania panamensis]CAJ2465618.1 unnamed protein product [Leishmania braziliensis]CAJ2466174.1 unnamed protein product [Leishmania bra
MVSQNLVRYIGYAGAAANWLIPIAGIMNLPTRPMSDIDPVMTSVMCVYSIFFMRWSVAIRPANYPLFACHATNSTVQAVTLSRWCYGIATKPKKAIV